MVVVMSSIVCTNPQYMFVLNSFEQYIELMKNIVLSIKQC